jgi:hypothetical protein
VLNARRNDRSPRVAALQVLLNRFGAGTPNLKVDGIFMNQTALALSRYKKDVMGQSTGTSADHADPAVWHHLMGRAHVQTVDAVDITDVNYLRTVMPWLSRHGAPVTLGGMSNGLAQVIGDVVRRANGNNIMLVRFHGHGGPGLQSIAHGTRKIAGKMDYNEELTVLNATTLQKLLGVVSQLASAMCSFGFVELHGCRVGKGPHGPGLVASLADCWKVPVSAGIPFAKSGYDKVAGSAVTFDLEGPIETAFPGRGNLASWSSRLNVSAP